MVYAFGQFTVQLNNETEQDLYFLSQWKETELEEDEAADVFLRIRSGTTGQPYSSQDGWTFSHFGEKKTWSYYDGKKLLFTVQYDASPNEIDVFACDQNPNNIRLGTQFALLLALHEKCIGLHGVTLLFGNEIVILSAPSGTGKTTLSHLLEKHCDAIVINGDFALLTPTEAGVIFEPTPFCGSSGRSLNHRVRVDKIVFLEQGHRNVWKCLTSREAMKQFMSNCFIPVGDADIQKAIQRNAIQCVSAVSMNIFSFMPNEEAARVFFDHFQRTENEF